MLLRLLSIKCDSCDNEFKCDQVNVVAIEVQQMAYKAGWVKTKETKDRCPNCRPRKLDGQIRKSRWKQTA